MKKLSALAALALSAPAFAAVQDLAPPVKGKPVAPAAASNPQAAVRAASPRDFQAALSTAAQAGGDSALDGSLIRVMSNLLAAGHCSEAASLAARDGRSELATKARQLCK